MQQTVEQRGVSSLTGPGPRNAILCFLLAGLFLIGTGIIIMTSAAFDRIVLSGMTMAIGAPVQPDWPRNLQVTALEIVIVGILLFASALFVIPRWRTVALLAEQKHFLFFSSLVAIVALWLPVVIFGRSTLIAGQRYWWLGDDAFISMRYARNFANGLGLVWNQGERVEGYTNFLWTLYMALLHLLRLSAAKISLFVLLTNVALAMLTVVSVTRFVRFLGGGTLAVAATLASFVLNDDVLKYCCFGLETSLLTLFVITCVYRVFEERQGAEPRLTTYFLIGIISLIRADAIIFSALLFALAILLCPGKRKKAVKYTVISLSIPFLHEVFRISYYGDVLPKTAYLKTLYWPGKYKAGLIYVARFVLRYSIPLTFAALSAIFAKNRIRLMLLIGLAAYIGYIAYIGGDAFSNFRFFVPILPILMALAFLSIQDLKLSGSRESLRPLLMVLCLISIPLLTPGYAVTLLYPYQGDPENIRIGLFLKNNTPKTSRVADFWGGATFYFSERYAIDLLGKSDRHIARLPAVAHANLPGHNKYDFSYSLGVLKPDYVNAMFKIPVDPVEMRRRSTGMMPFSGQLYFDPIFQKHCFPHPVPADTWRTIFACSW